jgi:glycerate dehydrogenase
MMHNLTASEPSEWKAKGTIIRHMRTAAGEAPLTVADEVCGILGYGAIGKLTITDCYVDKGLINMCCRQAY